MEYQAKQIATTMLNANEAYWNVSDEILTEIKARLEQVMFHRYPDETSHALIQAYSKVIQKDSKQIIAGNGSDEMLGFMISYYLHQGDVLFTLAPDFSMYDYYASLNDVCVKKYQTKEDGSFDMDDFIKEAKALQPKMILFSNPNNPTGHFVKNEEILKLVNAFLDTVIIIDEAYGEFSQASILAYVDTYPNLFVTRTLSKAYGLASARLGFLIGHLDVIEDLRKKIVPYNISTFDQIVGEVVLAHAHTYQGYIDEIKAERDLMYEDLKNLKHLTLYPSNANYLYGRSNYKQVLLDAFKEADIVIRNYADDSFRITIGSKEENHIVKEILRRVDQEVSV